MRRSARRNTARATSRAAAAGVPPGMTNASGSGTRRSRSSISASSRLVTSGVTTMKCCCSLSYSAASVASSAPTVKSSLCTRRTMACRPRSLISARATPSGLAADQPRAVRKEDDPLVVHDDVLDRQQLERFDLDLHLFVAFANQRGFWMFIPVDVAARQSPQSPAWLDVTPAEEDAPAI